jgi:DNA-binding FadR family transcriptional regulator
MARTARPIHDAATGNLLAMIARHQDKPCPSNREIMEWTGVARRKLQRFLAVLAAGGVIEIETRGRRPQRRRMRATGMPWTGWTQRGQFAPPPRALRPPR